MISDYFLPTDNVVLDQNVLVINTGDKLALFDTGMSTVKRPVAQTGRLLTSLQQAGIDPKDIDAVVLTHPHIDHCGGMVADDGSRIFPNAQVYMQQSRLRFLDGRRAARARRRKARRALRARTCRRIATASCSSRTARRSCPACRRCTRPGHTVGHTVYMITSGGKTHLQHRRHRPSRRSCSRSRAWRSCSTPTPSRASETRVKLFDMLAAQRIPLLVYHMPWPGIGHLAKQGDGFRYVPTPMQLVL